MVWLLLDVLLGLGSLVALGVVVLGLWRRVKALGSELASAGGAIGRATDDLAAAQSGLPARPATSGSPPRP